MESWEKGHKGYPWLIRGGSVSGKLGTEKSFGDKTKVWITNFNVGAMDQVLVLKFRDYQLRSILER